MSQEKIKRAEELCRPPVDDAEFRDPEYHAAYAEGMKIYTLLCTSSNLPPKDRIEAIASLFKKVPEEGRDMANRWRDMLPHLSREDKIDMVELLVSLVKDERIESYERLYTAATLYNHAMIHVCYECFAELTAAKELMVDHRVEAARYLYATDDYDFKQVAQEALIEIIETSIYPSDYRYRIIAGYIGRTGINSVLNSTKLKVEYDEEFVYGLQMAFFHNKENEHEYRILSGQHILQMECSTNEEKEEICNELLTIAGNEYLEENQRADAADVVLRLGKGDNKKHAREVLTDIGYDTVNSKGQTGSLLDRTKTVYTDSQNIHQFSEQVDKFIEKIINETDVQIKPYPEVHQEVSDLVRELVTATPEATLAENKFRAFKALNRISIDTAKFTKYNVTLAEIFVHVWIRVHNYEDEEVVQNLEKRMIDELVDMGETCSSGHSGRFVNVLSTYDDTLKISWDQQIKANMAGRMNARIRDCPDAEIRGSLAVATTELADENDKEVYHKFIQDNLEELRAELEDEFVGEGYVSSEEFEKIFSEGAEEW